MVTGSSGMRRGSRATAIGRSLVSALRYDLPWIMVSVTLVAVQSG